MLQKIRDSRGLGRKILIGFIIAVFGLWGVETLVGTLLQTTTVVKVNGVDIDETAVEYAYQRQYQRMVQDLGADGDLDSIDDDLVRELTVNELIQRELLNQTAKAHKMQLSNASIDRMIATTEAFQVNGEFSNELAQAVLNSAGYSPASFRAALAEDERINQILVGYAGSGFVTESEVVRIAALAEQTRDLRFVQVDYFDQAMEVSIGDDEVTSYYDEHQDDFIRNEQVAVDYIVLSRDALSEQIEVSEEQIAARYEEERSTFESQVERRASHILLEASSSEEFDAANTLATELKTRIDNGESFETLAEEYSSDTGSASYGGDVGYTTGDSFVEPFEDALRELEIDQVSEPVVSDFGVHLIKLTEMTSAEFETAEQAHDRILSELQLEGVSELYAAQEEQLGILAFESYDLLTPAEELGLEIQTTELFTTQGGVGVAANADFINVAFGSEVLEDGLNSEPIEIEEGTAVVMHLKTHLLPEVRPLEEVRVQIELLLRQNKVREMARTTGENILAGLENGNSQSVSAMLADLGIEWRTQTGLGRETTGVNLELKDWIFSIPAPVAGETSVDGILLSSGVYIVAEITDVTPGSIDQLEPEEQNSLKAYISQQTGLEDRANFLSNLQNSAEIRRL